ncbi:hypothetical protein [Paraburkholderia sp. J67]|uniref:hypothetical protein n=1 Tax=Paraburkholderia sp. J67 TaxID=2805435 RepID=UPI002ABDAF89|nr:hypothetical protein [Paraburkholderia sp. J67]
MKIDPVSRQESTQTSLARGTAGAVFVTPQALTDEAAGEEKGLRVLSKLSYCVAWLFGLEAFFVELEDVQGLEGRRRH